MPLEILAYISTRLVKNEFQVTIEYEVFTANKIILTWGKTYSWIFLILI